MIKDILKTSLLAIVIFVLMIQGLGLFIGAVSGSIHPDHGGWDCKPRRYIQYVAYSGILACELVKERDW